MLSSGYAESMSFLSPLQILDYMPLRSGDSVGDFGAGQGAYAHALLEKLGKEGAVYAFDIYEPHIESLHKARVQQKLDNLFSLCVDLNSHLPLKDAILHCSLVVNTLHALSDRGQFLSELNRVTKSGGHVLVSDWMHSFNNLGPAEEAVVTPGDAVRLFQSNGFSVGEMIPAGTHHWAFIATKP